ncbi:calcium release-activated calcium channel protein 1-like [Convolutriloba macropyga]|uniref:calcium release-activated calcium channel protein 1-like n=1 Tax=Convolutriloba macropyga TaxID=536237 RepID=UPI003F524587
MKGNKLAPPPLYPSIVITHTPHSSPPATPNPTSLNMESNMGLAASYNSSHNQLLRWRRLILSRSKLKASSGTSALLSGFAIIALVETQIQSGSSQANDVPGSLLVMFSVCTTILIAVHLLALLISTCILPNLEVELEDRSYRVHDNHITYYVDMAWILSTGVGIMLFLVEIALVCWIKFWPFNVYAAITATVIVVPLMFIFICFGVKFYWQLAVMHTENMQRDLYQLDSVARTLPKTSSVSSNVVTIDAAAAMVMTA